MTRVLVTGSSGFIGFHLSKKLLELGYEVVGIDNHNSYYDVSLKQKRLHFLESYKNFKFYKGDICNFDFLCAVQAIHKFEVVINLAAQAGVRHSILHPLDYIENNGRGFQTILELVRKYEIPKLIYASSSSVYGAEDVPLTGMNEEQKLSNPISLYAATKLFNELQATCYANLYNIKSVALRFFTVYGPWGRPDSAFHIFTKRILDDEPIDLYNRGLMKRSFSYVDDIVDGIVAAIEKFDSVKTPVFNLGSNKTVTLLEMVQAIESSLGKRAIINLMPIQLGDVPDSIANIDLANESLGFLPQIEISEGVSRYVNWFKEYYEYE